MNFSIVIPTYGDTAHLKKCLYSLRRFEPNLNYETIVVDDGSSPKEQKELEALCRDYLVELVLKDKNTGFASAVNAGITKSHNDIIILCNNDIEFTQPILNPITRTFELHPQIGIVGAYLTYPNGKVQHAGMKYSYQTKSFVHDNHNPAEDEYVIAVTGALMAIKRDVINQVGNFNEKYFLACEDTDYCLRAWKAGFSVYYSSKVKAIHIEGATRGNTPAIKKNKKKEWLEAEVRGIAQFKASLKDPEIKFIDNKIAKLNTKPLKIEIGSGFNPHPGYKHLDIRRGLPGLDYVCDFSKEKLPFDDGTVSEILANHVIEHISIRKLPFVLSEWRRVLIPGGLLTLRTPNLEFIVKSYIEGRITPEWPGDEKFIKDNLSEKVDSSWWANLKLFSGQDYESNFHHVCFDFTMLSNLLTRFGFKKVERVKLEKEFSPGELQVRAYV